MRKKLTNIKQRLMDMDCPVNFLSNDEFKACLNEIEENCEYYVLTYDTDITYVGVGGELTNEEYNLLILKEAFEEVLNGREDKDTIADYVQALIEDEDQYQALN